MRPGPVICRLASRATVDWWGNRRRRGGGHSRSPPFRNKAIVLHSSWGGCRGLQTANKPVSTPVLHHPGGERLDSEPNDGAQLFSRVGPDPTQVEAAHTRREERLRGNKLFNVSSGHKAQSTLNASPAPAAEEQCGRQRQHKRNTTPASTKRWCFFFYLNETTKKRWLWFSSWLIINIISCRTQEGALCREPS